MLAKSTSLKWGLVLFFMLSSLVSFAQRTITGKVIGSNNEPASGATVTVTGTNIGTQTDANGNFTISVPQGKNALTVSYVGFELQQVNLTDQSAVNVTLKASNLSLSEVVVTGYSSQQRKNIVGAVSTVKGE